MGVTGEDVAALAALRQLPAEKLLTVPVAVGTIVGGGEGGGRAFRFGPVVDGYVLPRSPGEVWSAGQMHRVPLIAGSLLDDGSVFSRANPVQRLLGYRLVLRTIFGPDTDAAMEQFPAARDEAVPAAMHRLITVTSFRRRSGGWCGGWKPQAATRGGTTFRGIPARGEPCKTACFTDWRSATLSKR